MRENEAAASGIGDETGIQEKSMTIEGPKRHSENRDDSSSAATAWPVQSDNPIALSALRSVCVGKGMDKEAFARPKSAGRGET